MAKKPDIDFYRERDEAAFLDRWETDYDELDDAALEALYESMAEDIHQKYTDGTHELGKPYMYKGVFVGESDYNAFLHIYLFSDRTDS